MCWFVQSNHRSHYSFYFLHAPLKAQRKHVQWLIEVSEILLSFPLGASLESSGSTLLLLLDSTNDYNHSHPALPWIPAWVYRLQVSTQYHHPKPIRLVRRTPHRQQARARSREGLALEKPSLQRELGQLRNDPASEKIPIPFLCVRNQNLAGPRKIRKNLRRISFL